MIYVLMACPAFLLGAWASYAKRDSQWFPWICVGIGALNAVMWIWAARSAASQRQLFAISAAWDAAMLVAYYLLPLVAFGVKLEWKGALGLVLLVAGAWFISLSKE